MIINAPIPEILFTLLLKVETKTFSINLRGFFHNLTVFLYLF